MPSIMGAFDAIISSQTKTKYIHDPEPKPFEKPTPKRSTQTGNFANLSPCVQKILSNVPDQEISKKFSSEEYLAPQRTHLRQSNRSLAAHEKSTNRSNENLDIISANVQKMLSNFADSELVIDGGKAKGFASGSTRNSSYLHKRKSVANNRRNVANDLDGELSLTSVGDVWDGCKSDKDSAFDSDKIVDSVGGANQRPLGSYLHCSYGIAPRTPIGRNNMKKFLQVPSSGESTVCNTSSTASSEVSRPVSLTSLGSCSSSGSSNGHHQHGSAYLASAESLDSDPEPAGSADSGIAEQEQPNPISQQQRVLAEVLETETVYVADLKEVIEGYLKPWRADPSCPLADHLQHLFSNLEQIYEFNRSFLGRLKEADCEATKTANCFLQHDAGFHVYTEYCTDYPRTMEVLGHLTRDPEVSAMFREKQTLLGHALPLGSYLLKPVQRILKYHLLLQRLSKLCEPAHRPAVDLALRTMTGIAADINGMKRKHEHAVRVQEIQSQLFGWPGPDLTALGELVAEGNFRAVGARGRRHCFLFEKVLLLAKARHDGALAYKTHIECSNLMLNEQVRGEPLSFHVIPFDEPRRQCTLKARSPMHKRDWTLQIKRVILENYSAVIPNHARQLVLQLGQDAANESEDANANDKWSPLRQYYSPPNYLEERRCRAARKTRHSGRGRRSSSHDRPFASLASWRRKSEPGEIPQYNCKTMPKKIAKLKMAKECGSSTFYMNLSDPETESNGIANGNENEDEEAPRTSATVPEAAGSPEKDERGSEAAKGDLEKIVSDILMENGAFLKRAATRANRRTASSEPTSVWYEEEEEEEEGVKVPPSKADSLPRSFQLNESEKAAECGNGWLLSRAAVPKDKGGELDELPENDLSSQLDDTSHPDHKIYRQSAMRLSMVQRIRLIMSEQKLAKKYPLHKQGSKSMGEKIANPYYADPQKLFCNSRNGSRINLEQNRNSNRVQNGDRTKQTLDLSLNEKEVLEEVERRLEKLDTGQNPNLGIPTHESDSFYESLLDSSLVEEYVTSNGRLVVKQDSFSDKSRTFGKTVRKPTRPPPPIPVKPARLSRVVKNFDVSVKSAKNVAVGDDSSRSSNTSWVKSMVERFE